MINKIKNINSDTIASICFIAIAPLFAGALCLALLSASGAKVTKKEIGAHVCESRD